MVQSRSPALVLIGYSEGGTGEQRGGGGLPSSWARELGTGSWWGSSREARGTTSGQKKVQEQLLVTVRETNSVLEEQSKQGQASG